MAGKCLSVLVFRRYDILRSSSSAAIAYNSRRYTHPIPGRTVKIGCASGFYGDTAVAAPQLIYGSNIDFLVFDYLSEITMSLLTVAKTKQSDLGYAPDFVQVSMAPFIKDIKQKGIRVISNAGGVNPHSCAAALKQVCDDNDVDMNIAVVTGDDLMPQIPQLEKLGITDMDSGSPLPKTVHSMNAYLGAGPIARALDLGADIVITGRCVDSALALAPLLHSFKWSMDNFDLLAAGSLAGHLIECGAQVTGGIFTDWHKVDNWDQIGFPVVECFSDGGFVVSKPAGTGGLVSVATVSEQMLYEVGDPSHYFLPDVVCDFTNVTLTEIQEGNNDGAVYVTGARGNPPSGEYKVSATYATGYRATAVAGVGGPRAKDKAEKTADAIIKRCKKIFKQLSLRDFTRVQTSVIGSEDMYGPHSHLPEGSREVMLWLAVHHTQKKALEFFSREVAPAGTGMAPGLTGIVAGRPRVSPVLQLFSFLYPKDSIQVGVYMNGQLTDTYAAPTVPTAEYPNKSLSKSSMTDTEDLEDGPYTFRLEDLAYTRSGDKGNTANIGVVARHPSILPYLRKTLTVDRIAEYFAHMFTDTEGPVHNRVQRFDVPGIYGLNFVLYNVLGGGGIASLRMDPQGKALGQILLDIEIANVPNLMKYER